MNIRHIAKLCALALASIAAACGPNLSGLEEGEQGKVAEIRDGDTLVLDNGLRVTLTGIEAPFGNEPYAAEARAALEELAMGRPARLAYGGLRRQPARTRPTLAPASADAATPEEQSSETALAQVFVQSEGGRWIWLQQAMIQRGAAWARPRKENMARLDELMATEKQARDDRAGLWALADYRVRTVQQMEQETLPEARCGRGPFRMVEGIVTDVAHVRHDDGGESIYLNFGPDYRTDFTVAIYSDDAAAWSGAPLDSFEGKKIVARGRAIARGGPLICADNAMQIALAD
ncbi:MAG: thermonuclease family protein [Caulobacterales bacterium]